MILEVRNGKFSYGDVPIFTEISFALDYEKIMTVLGPNGVGKTTLLKCIMGFLPWDSGEIMIEGKPFKLLKEKEIWKVISYVPQAKKSIFSYKVLDMVVMGLNPEYGFFCTPKREHYDRARDILKLIGYEKLERRYCNELSGGELQMVMIARALVSNPKLLILDEPESNLDMKNQLRVLTAIEKAVHEMHSACLINTHFPDHALNISDQTLFLGNGQEKLCGPTKELLTEENMKRFFGVFAKKISFTAGEQRYQTIFPYKIS